LRQHYKNVKLQMKFQKTRIMRLCIFVVIFALPIIGSAKDFYALDTQPAPNYTCFRDNEKFQPCGTLENLLYFPNINRIYVLDNSLQISRNTHLNFSSQFKVELKAWRNSTLSTILCENDFSMAFKDVNEVIVQSIQFKQCGQSNPLIMINTGRRPVKLVQIINVSFVQSGQSSLQAVSDIHELQVVGSKFTGGRKAADINAGTVLKALFINTTFSNNNAGSLIIHNTHNESSLDIQNRSFSDNNVTDSHIPFYYLHSIVIISSYFERNLAENVIWTEGVNLVHVTDSHFYSNVVQNGSVLNINSINFSLSNNYFVNNTGDKGIVSINGSSTDIRNCVFQGNVVNESTLVITESLKTVITGTIFENNQALLGGAVVGRSIQNLLIFKSNFTKNHVAVNGGVLNVVGETITIRICRFISNVAEENGGALQILAQKLNIIESHYFNNTAVRGHGGAINIVSDLYVETSNFSSNRASNGGAFYINYRDQGYTVINNTTFENNQAETDYGGAVAIANIKTVDINASTFVKNSAPLGACGALFILASNLTVRLSTFSENLALSAGAIGYTGFNMTMESSNFSRNHGISDSGALTINMLQQ